MAAADHAFSLAINSLKMPSLASQFNIHFLTPQLLPMNLLLKVASCAVADIGVTEMTVTNQNGKLIAKAPTTVPLPCDTR